MTSYWVIFFNIRGNDIKNTNEVHYNEDCVCIQSISVFSYVIA